jgi:hypothetical protein
LDVAPFNPNCLTIPRRQLFKPHGDFVWANLKYFAVFDHDGVLAKTHFLFESCMCGLTKAGEGVVSDFCKFFFAHDSPAFVICSAVDEAVLIIVAIAAELKSKPIR